jgi:hypothetical protein
LCGREGIRRHKNLVITITAFVHATLVCWVCMATLFERKYAVKKDCFARYNIHMMGSPE